MGQSHRRGGRDGSAALLGNQGLRPRKRRIEGRRTGRMHRLERGLGHFCRAIAGTLCGKEVEGTTARQIEDCLQCEVYILRHGFSDEEYARISDSDVSQVAELLLEHGGEYARICPALRAEGLLAVGTVVGRDIWKRIVQAIDESERRDDPANHQPED